MNYQNETSGGRAGGSAGARGYVLVERNIHLTCGKYRVLITRRPKNIYGGRFSDLSEARRVRDELEQTVKPSKPWGIRGRIVETRRTQQQLRAERLSDGMCQVCGYEPPKPGRKACKGCCDFQNQKRMLARREAHNAEVSRPAPKTKTP